MIYDLSRFSTQSFERFAQSLAVAQFGAGTQIYGAGPDGGREATFEGQFRDVGDQNTYDGYVVVQAKYRKILRSTQEDLNWLIAQADAELKKFANPRRKLRRPDYYVLVSNITLTPGAVNAKGKGKGTLDAMLAHLEGWKTTLGVKHVFLWHADTLHTLLDVHPQLHATFSNWVTPGDVLSAALKRFARPNFDTVVSRLMRDELKDQRGLKTQDSSQSHGRPIYVDDVFVDLPLEPASLFQSYDEDETDGSDEIDDEGGFNDGDSESDEIEDIDVVSMALDKPNWNIANQVMVRLADKFDSGGQPKKAKNSTFQRIVVLGGPGQGKSTIGQFLAQLLRARLIANTARVPPEVSEIADVTLARAKAEHIDLSGPLRFPIHIALPRYADAINKNEHAPSLLSFATTHMSKLAEEDIDVSLLREWLGQFPALIILDGLDEVPRTSNRSDVIRAIERLVADLYEADADAMLVVTSRPQGYLDDLDRRHWAHWNLADLDTPNAIRFAARLGEVLVPEVTRRQEVISILAEAANDTSTAPLMISPLQISLLFSLVLTRNDIPKDRWTLFERHYETLRDREIAKGGTNGDLIRDYRSEIDLIHYDAGFILQVRAELAGNASAHFSIPEFKTLVIRNLQASIVDSREATRIAERIMVIATTRLVFLGDRNEGRIAFDVRSLQEFMAAARVMVSPETKIKERLTEIALKSHWSHVFRIASSKIYALPGLQELREDILEILDKFDHGDFGHSYRVMRAGARLAINLLADATAGARQTDRVKLMARAVGVLEIEGQAMLAKLVTVADAVTQGELKRAVEVGLMTAGGPHFTNSLRILVLLSRQPGHQLRSWALDKLSSMQLAETAVAALAELGFSGPLDDATRAFATRIIWSAGPVATRRYYRLGDVGTNQLDGLRFDKFFNSESCLDVREEGEDATGFEVVYQSISNLRGVRFRIPSYLPPENPWRVVKAAINFSDEPSPESLARAIESASLVDESRMSNWELPWPVASCLAAISQKHFNSAELAAAVRAGRQGGRADWEAAEAQWSAEGIALGAMPRPYLEDLDLRIAAETGPPARHIRKTKNFRRAARKLLDASHGWSARDRLSVLRMSWFLSDTPDDAGTVVDWMQDDLYDLDWSPQLCRQMTSLLRLYLDVPERVARASKIIQKLPASTEPYQRDGVAAGLVAMLQEPPTAAWAAVALYAGLPLQSKSDIATLRALDPRYFDTPIDARPLHSKALLVLRLALKIFSEEDLELARQVLLESDPDVPLSTVLRKIYSGQKEDDALEKLICQLAEAGMENDGRERSALINIITQLTASRRSAFDDEDRLLALGLPSDVAHHAV